MKNKKLLAGLLASAVLAAGISASYADFGGKRLGDYLSEEEKTSIESMTSEEKREFFQEKKEVHFAERQAKEEVIDTLLAGDTLTSEQEILRAEIISQRAERRAGMEERRAEMEELAPILQKKRSGEELTEEEQAKLDEFRSNHSGHKGGFKKEGFKKGGNRGMGR